MHYQSIPIPFDLTPQELVLDPAAHGATMDEEMAWIVDSVAWESEELERIFRSMVVLHAAKAGTLAECLRTAIIWERG